MKTFFSKMVQPRKFFVKYKKYFLQKLYKGIDNYSIYYKYIIYIVNIFILEYFNVFMKNKKKKSKIII